MWFLGIWPGRLGAPSPASSRKQGRRLPDYSSGSVVNMSG